MSGRAGAEGDQPLRRSAHSGPACRPYADFPGNPTARLKPCPDTKPKTKPRVPLRSDSCEFRRIGSSATLMSHTLRRSATAASTRLRVLSIREQHMRTKLILLFIVLASAVSAQITGGWQLVWSDEFNGTAGSPPDPTKWNYDLGGGGWGNGEIET